jgi:2-isopropylmalate synthase
VLIARQLDRLGVDAIEAGTPITSKEEFRSVKCIATEGLKAEVYGLARLRHADVDAVIRSGINHIHLFITTSDIHLEQKLHMTRDQAVRTALELIDYAKSHGLNVEFSAEDATRTDLKYLKHFYHEVDQAGVIRINIPDTLGIMTPNSIYTLVKELKSVITIPLSVHCHDDFGMAVANSIAGLQAGADQVHVAVNGLGERAGNASLEEIVMALTILHKTQTNIIPALIYPTSQLVSRLTGVPVQPNKAIVGENAFTHEAGIHTHGVTSHPLTYEPINPELVGRKRTLIAGKHAGMHGIQAILIDFGLRPSAEQLRAIVERAKELGDHGKIVTDNDLLEITFSIMGVSLKEEPIIRLTELAVMTGTKMTPTASVRVIMNDRAFTSVETGVGPVDAAMKALQKLTRNQVNVTLREYRIEALTGGSNAVAEVIIKVEDMSGNVVSSRSANEDIVKASVNAMIIGINRLLTYQKYYGSN